MTANFIFVDLKKGIMLATRVMGLHSDSDTSKYSIKVRVSYSSLVHGRRNSRYDQHYEMELLPSLFYLLSGGHNEGH